MEIDKKKDRGSTIFTRRFPIALFITAVIGCGEDSKHNRAEQNGVSADTPITVFAAASTTNVISKVVRRFEQQTQTLVTLSFASSSTLAKQIERGAPADVFLSASPKWTSHLAQRGLIDPKSRKNLFGNRLVLIGAGAQKDRTRLKITDILTTALKDRRLAMGDPAHVPAGIYGQQALTSLGLWQRLQHHVARQPNVRSALALVERQEAALGIVYATDAAISQRVKILAPFPPDSHAPIIYPIAAIRHRLTARVQRFLDHLDSPEAKNLYREHGFEVAK